MARTKTFVSLMAVSFATATLGAAACSSKASGGPSPSPTPSPTPFNPVGCQIIWLTHDPAGQQAIVDYYIVDMPVGKWVVGTNSYFVGDPTGATNISGGFVFHFNVATKVSEASTLATSGIFSVGTDPQQPTQIGNPVAFTDSTPQDYFLLNSAGQLTTDMGPSGTGAFQGQWSDPGSPDVVPGNGTIEVAFNGSSLTMGSDLAYGQCYEAGTPFAAMSFQQRAAEAVARMH